MSFPLVINQKIIVGIITNFDSNYLKPKDNHALIANNPVVACLRKTRPNIYAKLVKIPYLGK